MTGDGCHFLARLLILYRIGVQQNATDFSTKTQELFLLVFCTRYLDVFTRFFSLYNTFMKVFYTTATFYTVYKLRWPSGPFRRTVNYFDDPFPHWLYAVFPSAIIAFLCHIGQLYITRYDPLFNAVDFLWTFSIVLEGVAMLPQALLIHRKKMNVDGFVLRFTALIWAYRALYILNWIYRSYHEPFYQHHALVYMMGIVQTLIILTPWIAERLGLYNSDNLFDNDGDAMEESNGPDIYNLLLTEEGSNVQSRTSQKGG